VEEDLSEVTQRETFKNEQELERQRKEWEINLGPSTNIHIGRGWRTDGGRSTVVGGMKGMERGSR
jgi:hypothetical protein